MRSRPHGSLVIERGRSAGLYRRCLRRHQAGPVRVRVRPRASASLAAEPERACVACVGAAARARRHPASPWWPWSWEQDLNSVHTPSMVRHDFQLKFLGRGSPTASSQSERVGDFQCPVVSSAAAASESDGIHDVPPVIDFGASTVVGSPSLSCQMQMLADPASCCRLFCYACA